RIAADGMHRRVLRCDRGRPTTSTATTASTEGGAILIARLEKMRIRREQLGRHLLERRHVVEHPERPAVRGGDAVALLAREIGDGHRREVELQPRPAPAVV